MSWLPYRNSIALAAVVVVMLSSRPAEAQVCIEPDPTREPGGLVKRLITGVQYDIVNQAKAERCLPHLYAKLRRDGERGNVAAVDRDVYRIDNLRYRIVVDEWLIRKNSLKDPGCYPYPFRMDPITSCAIAQYRSPSWSPGQP